MDRRTVARGPSAEAQVGVEGVCRYAVSIFLLSAFLLLASGCDKYTRHDILTIFFTGVPHPDEEEVVEERDLTPEELWEKRRKQYTVPAYVHGPYAAQQCYQCHSSTKSVSFRKSAKGAPVKTIKSVDEVGGRLVLPIKELCIDCHTGKSVESAFFEGYWIHGPVSDGICTVCHNPHSSPYPYMLVKGNSQEMCRNCHASGFIMQIEEHKKDEDCINCHNPHIGKNRFLLKKDFDEGSIK